MVSWLVSPVPLSKLSLFSYSYRQYLKQESLDKKRKEFDANGWSLLSKRSQVGVGRQRLGEGVSLSPCFCFRP